LAGFKWKLDRHLRDKRGYIYISFSFLPLYCQLYDLDPLTHQVKVQVQVHISLSKRAREDGCRCWRLLSQFRVNLGFKVRLGFRVSVSIRVCISFMIYE